MSAHPPPDWTELVRRHLRGTRGDESIAGGPQRFDEIAEEIAQHLDDQYEDALRSGLSPAEAKHAVLVENADWPSLALAIRQGPTDTAPNTRERLMESFVQDIRFAMRSLAARPLFAASVVLLLALGIGANSALFTVVNSVLFAPLPYGQPGELASVTEATRGEDGALEASNIKAANLRDLRRRSATFEDFTGYWQGPAVRTGSDEPELLAVIRATHNFFAVLEVDAAVGTTFSAQPEEAAYSVVLDHGYWERRFAADPGVIGTTLTLDEESYTLVGVMPEAFRFVEKADAYIVGPQAVPEPPLNLGDDYESDRSTGYMKGIGRLRPGVSLESAREELDRIGRDLEAEFPNDQGLRTFIATPLRESLVGSVQGALLLLLGAVGLVLLIACANVANLLLARATGRRKEIAVRTALGASTSRVVRQLLTESLALSAAGGLLGIAVAVLAMEPLRGFIPGNLPRAAEIAVDVNVLGFTLVVSILTGLLFGAAPALQSAATDVQSVIRSGARGASGGRSRARLRDSLVVVEIAIALVLLIGAGMTLRSLMELQSQELGFEPNRVLTMRFSLPQAKYDSDAKITAFYWRLFDEIGALPGVESTATVLGLPFSGTRANFNYAIYGEDALPPGREHAANFQAVSPGYFDTLGIPLLAGRDFTRADSTDAPVVAIVNEALVRRHFPDGDPTTKALQLDAGPDAAPVPIVGVVGDTRHFGYDREAGPHVYLSFEQMTFSFTSLVIRTGGDPQELVASVRSKIFEIDPDQPVYRVQTLSGLMADSVAQPRFNSGLLGAFAAVAVLLAAVGVFGVISYSVTQRTRELGIRMALGADAGNVMSMVLGHGALLVALGVASGLAVAVAVSRAAGSLWYGVSATDPLVFFVVPTILTAVALLATYVPARRATHVDPVIALRSD